MKREFQVASLAALAWATIAVPAFAQDASAGAQDAASEADAGASGDIIVTARRRNETTLETPVVVTAISGEQLSRLGVTNVTDVAKLTPQLMISPGAGPQGGNLTLRGVASPTSNAAAEPAITINIDGVPVSYGGVVRMSAMDIGQIEVLKGPQALFFGKNSSGGIVSIRSAEPTSSYKSQLSVGYEFNAQQVDIDGYVSGPISSTLDARIAGRITRQQGYFDNVAPNPGFLHSPGTRESGVRLSLNWRPTDRLTVKLRGTYDHVRENGSYSTSQKASCPTGVARGAGAVAGTDDCTLNDTVVYAPFPGAAARAVTGNPRFDSDQNYLRVSQQLYVADASYELADHLTLNSVSGYYRLRQNVLEAQTVGARFYIGGISAVDKDTFSQELRLAYSNPDSPFDAMIGGFYQDDLLKVREAQIINVGAPGGPDNIRPLGQDLLFRLPSRAYSAFAQAGFKFTDALSLSAGLRYSRDVKRQSVTTPVGITNKFTVRETTYDDWSPEVTVSFKPNENTNLFASFKEGYKSGAYQVGSNSFAQLLPNPAITSIDNSYRPERVRGFEAGLKMRLLDRQLRLNMAAYTYLYKDLQVSRLDPATVTLQILNASSARVKGVEADFSFSPRGVPGLTITGAASYNRSRYASTFFAPCYVGQTVGAGCTLDGPDADAIPDQQNFIGRPLPRAPEFSGSLGFNYEMPVGESSKVSLNANGIYTTSSFVSQELTPVGMQPKRLLLDASVAFGSQSGSYELAFLGRNLTNRHYLFSGFQTPGTGSGTGTLSGGFSDFEGIASRGRELWMRLTIRPSAF